MPPVLVELLGATAAVLTTLCWLPQAAKIIRDKDTRAISLPSYSTFALGIACWLGYGLALVNWPLIAANTITLGLTVAIVVLKLRHG